MLKPERDGRNGALGLGHGDARAAAAGARQPGVRFARGVEVRRAECVAREHRCAHLCVCVCAVTRVRANTRYIEIIPTHRTRRRRATNNSQNKQRTLQHENKQGPSLMNVHSEK